MGGKPVTAEDVPGKLESFLLRHLWNTAPTQTGFVNESTDNKNGLHWCDVHAACQHVLFPMSPSVYAVYANRSY